MAANHWTTANTVHAIWAMLANDWTGPGSSPTLKLAMARTIVAEAIAVARQATQCLPGT